MPNTSPTVAPSTATDAWPSAWARSTVGSLISTAMAAGYNPTRPVEIPVPAPTFPPTVGSVSAHPAPVSHQLLAGIWSVAVEYDGDLGDRLLAYAVGAQHRRSVAKGD